MAGMSIASGYFETQARRSARWALVRNGLFVAVFVGFLTMVLVKGPAAGSGASLSTAVGLNSLFITLFGWRLIVAARRLLDVARHPIFRDFAVFGDPLALARSLEEEVAAGVAKQHGDVIVSPRWLVTLGLGHGVIPLAEVAWVYPKTTSRSINFIPIGTSETLEIFTLSSAGAHVSHTISMDGAILKELLERAPWAWFGYTAERAARWSTAKEGALAEIRRARDGRERDAA